MTSDLSTRLINILHEELDAYRRLVDFLGHQRQLVVQRRIEEIQQSLEEEESLIRQTERLAEARNAASLVLAQSLGIHSDIPPKISDLLPLLDADTALELRHIREALISAVDSLSDLTATNQFLITYALRLAAKSLAIMEGTEDGDIVYAQTGRRDPGDQTTLNVIDRKI